MVQVVDYNIVLFCICKWSIVPFCKWIKCIVSNYMWLQLKKHVNGYPIVCFSLLQNTRANSGKSIYKLRLQYMQPL